MAKGPSRLQTNDQIAPFRTEWFHLLHDGNLTADKTYKFVAPFDGYVRSIDDIIFGLGTTGVGGTRINLFVSFRSVLSTLSIFGTVPGITPAAANGANTGEGGDGVTKGTLISDSARRTFSKGDLITVLFDETGAYTTDAADAFASIGLTHLQDFDPDINVERG